MTADDSKIIAQMAWSSLKGLFLEIVEKSIFLEDVDNRGRRELLREGLNY